MGHFAACVEQFSRKLSTTRKFVRYFGEEVMPRLILYQVIEVNVIIRAIRPRCVGVVDGGRAAKIRAAWIADSAAGNCCPRCWKKRAGVRNARIALAITIVIIWLDGPVAIFCGQFVPADIAKRGDNVRCTGIGTPEKTEIGIAIAARNFLERAGNLQPLKI